jgi:hypothetical protein
VRRNRKFANAWNRFAKENTLRVMSIHRTWDWRRVVPSLWCCL